MWSARTSASRSSARPTKELLRGEGKTTGRLDTRFTGRDIDSVGEETEFDPASASLDGAFSAAINDYIRRDLKQWRTTSSTSG